MSRIREEYWTYSAGQQRGKYPTLLDALEALLGYWAADSSIYLVTLNDSGNVVKEPELVHGVERRD